MDAASAPLVRPARPADVPAVARLAEEALRDKYRPAFGRRATEAIEALMLHDLDASPDLLHWVAELDGRVAGTARILMVAEEDGDLTPHVQTLIDAIGPWRTRWAMTVLLPLHPGRLADGDAYIDELAVAGWARRRGVGRALLRRCEEEARARGRHRVTLWVTLDNVPARALYDGAGFREERRTRWLVSRLVFRAPGMAFMARELRAP